MELLIFTSNLVYNVDRPLTITEKKNYDILANYYGNKELKQILDNYSNTNDICIAIKMTLEETTNWKKKTHKYIQNSKHITKLDNRNIDGNVWRFIGN